ncbi:MAG TPA: Nramp family divalent metal transporter [Rubrobacteraceae bacterium]|nr:Nramp family divalent metal transporter [Rubrobacteraceae bacterium]
MAEATERRGELATELPSKHLPGVQYRDMPEPLPLGKIVGASVVLLATALGSGELIIWPYITSQVGIGLLWLAFVGFSMQYFLNMEIERYTLATGETAVTGFTRFWKPWGIIFCLGAFLPNMWPGWATGGATMISYLFGFETEGTKTVAILAIIGLVAIGVAITVSPVIYQTIEKVQFFLVGFIALFMVVALVFATKASSWAAMVTQAPSGVANFPSLLGELGIATLLGAIAFAGAGGANNLTQSNYIRDKGMGMGIHIPRIVSPITGEEVAAPSLGYMTKTDEPNVRRWKGWWSVANKEQIVTFYIVGLITLIGLSVLVHSTGAKGEAADPSFLQTEAQVLGRQIGYWFEVFFYLAGFAILFSTNLGIIDYVSRLIADSLKVSFFSRSEAVTESRIYFTVAWLMIIFGSIVLLAGFDQPLVLLIIASSGGGVVMAFYSWMLIVLNRRALPAPIRLKGWRLPIMYVIAVFFSIFSVLLVYDVVRTNVFGG